MTNITHIAKKRKVTNVVLALAGLAIVITGVNFASSDALRASTSLSTTPVVATTVTPALNLPLNIADIVERVSPAVVSILVTHAAEQPATAANPPNFNEFLERFFDEDTRRRFNDQFRGRSGPQQRQQPTQGVGSGFVIDKAGLIVTNHHVIDGAAKIEIEFKDGKKRAAKIIGTDPKTDLALLKVEAKQDLPFVKFGPSTRVRVGEWVVTMGNPFGLSQTATTGIISARHRNIGAGPFDDFLQIDAAINQGNSGGPTFNLKGEVIGVNTAIFSPSGGNVGIGFAIPSAIAEKIVDELRTEGHVKRGWLGVQIQSVTDELAVGLNLDQAKGALVSHVGDNSPADRAGIERGDVVLSVGGQEVPSLRKLPALVADLKPGTKTTLKVWRDGSEMVLSVVIGEGAKAPQSVAAIDQKTAVAGLVLSSINPRSRKAFGLDANQSGVVVTGVTPGSAAAQQGLRPGDVIVSVGDIQVETPGDVADEIRTAKKRARKAVLLLVKRDASERFVALTLRDA